jgi:long-chain acyl-CoA synthetase
MRYGSQVMSSPAHNAASMLARTARAWPRLPAIAHGSRVVCDYAALAARAATQAAALRDAGLAPGDRVAIVSRNDPAYIETLFGCWWAGLTVVPVNAKLHPTELAYVLENSGARWAFVDAAWSFVVNEATRGEGQRGSGGSGGGAGAGAGGGELERAITFGSHEHAALMTGERSRQLSNEPMARALDDPAWLFYTSGTTGRPKGVVITHGNLAAMTRCFLADVEAIAPGDAILHPAPLSHGSGLYALPHVHSGAVNVIPESGAFEPDEVLDLLARWDRACFFAAPTMLKRLVAAPALGHARVDRLKSIVCGGAPLYVADAKAALAALGPRLAQIYGQGESPMTITAMNRHVVADAAARGDDARLGSVGIAQTGMEVRVADANDAPLPIGAVGEVLVRGPAVMPGYWGNPEATRAALAHGWLHTGDVGSLDADGFLTLMDRSKDLIISGGSNIYPREVEEVLQRHPDVAEVAVVGRAHADWGEEVVACVVARAGAAGDASAQRQLDAALDRLCLDHIARFKRPKAYVFLPELPKNNTGKVLKTALRERLNESARGNG